MAEEIPDDMWTPFKNLQNIVDLTLFNRSKKADLSQLELTLRKSKQSFTSLLKNLPKNEKNRAQIKQGITDGITIPGSGHVILSKDLVDESIIISDMYNLDEYNAVELLCTAQQQMGHYPGLPRGLVAVLLYYDGRKAVVTSLRDLFQARTGVSWCTEVQQDITHIITTYTDSLVADSNILNRIIELIQEMDITKELEILNANRALGTPKHQRQVLDLFEDIRVGLATSLFNWSAQCGLPKQVIENLMEYLSKYKPHPTNPGIDNVTLTMLMALLYSFDTSILQRHEDIEKIVKALPVIKEVDFAQTVHNYLNNSGDWEWDNKLKSIVSFAFGLSMATLRNAPQQTKLNSEKIIEKDESIVEQGIQYRVFDFIHAYLLECELTLKTEFFYRRVHMLLTDFIDFMHSKVSELRGRADETAKTVHTFSQQALDPPSNLDRSFEALMLSVGKLYSNDKLGLKLCMEYWGPMEIPSNYVKSTSTSRSVSLFKFIRLAGELLPPILFVPYLKMLSGLSSCELSARNTFNLLKQGSGFSGSTTLSWDHFFGSLGRYYANLRQEQSPTTDTIYRNRVLNKNISPEEIEGLHAVLEIIRVVAEYDEIARIALCEHPNWTPIYFLLGLLSCSVPITLKADILLTLSALGKSNVTAFQLWNNLESSQIIRTIPTTATMPNTGLADEIEQNESRNGTYPMSRALLDLLYTLVTTATPRNLGVGTRNPGLDPYFTFLVDVILLKFYSRNYKTPSEKWEVGEKCLRVLYHFVKTYVICPTDFNTRKEENSQPGYHVMMLLNTKSDTLKLILQVIDDARSNLDRYSPIIGKSKLEGCVLYCLKIIEKALLNQDLFFDAHSVANSSIYLSGINKLLLDLNPSSGRPDHVLNTTKFVTYNSWLPLHALVAVNILRSVARQPNVSAQLLGMFTHTEKIQTEIRHGFVECLENDPPPLDDNESFDRDNPHYGIKIAIMSLILDCLAQPSPNIALYLLGVDPTTQNRIVQGVNKGISFNASNSCAKSLMTLLDNNLELLKSGIPIGPHDDNIIEKAYELLHNLCKNQKTSEVILRFLRSRNDFLGRHISVLPFHNFKGAQVLNQMSFLLKCVAIELKISAENNQVGHFSNLCKILLGVVNITAQENLQFELHNYMSSSHLVDQTIGESIAVNKKTSELQSKKILITHLLDCIDFETKILPHPKWSFFDNTLTTQILRDCENRTIGGPKLINIRKLYDILIDELNTVQSSIATGQRQLILDEIESVLQFALKLNKQKNEYAATLNFTEAWGQVTEILFTLGPVFALPVDVKREIMLDTLQYILEKVVPIDVMLELANLISGTVLILLVNLRNCKTLTPLEEGNAQLNGNITISFAAKSNSIRLKFILRNIIEWIVSSGVASQKLRINLYASLLNFMHIVKSTPMNKIEDFDEFYVSRLDRSVSYRDADSERSEFNQLQMTVEVFTSFGDQLIDILCHDCIGGHDICKMLALSCIDTLLEMDSLTSFIHFIANRGYLSHLIDSLLKTDDSLCRVLKAVPDNMRALYVYESKIATLCRIAGTHIGAELLLENKLFGVLSNMKVFDLHPDFQLNYFGSHHLSDNNSFVPPVEARYQQILFPALNLCDCIITTLGLENKSATSQVIGFLLSHGETIEIILRSGNPSLRLGMLKELSAITGLIARSINQETSSISELHLCPDVGAHMYRLGRLMLALFPKFITSEGNFKKLSIDDSIYDEPDKYLQDKNRSLHVKHFLEIASNLSLYCRNSIANHSADHRTTSIIFSPSITEATLQRKETGGNNALDISPSLGIVVNQLKCTVEHFNREKCVYDKLVRHKSTLPDITLNTSARKQFTEYAHRLTEKQNELNYCAFITEHCLYLLWSHLDFYMKRALPINTLQTNDQRLSFKNDTYISSPHEAGWKISSEDISHLKKKLICVFNETFCRQLLTTTNAAPTTDKDITVGFVDCLLRRIKCLIQFVPV